MSSLIASAPVAVAYPSAGWAAVTGSAVLSQGFAEFRDREGRVQAVVGPGSLLRGPTDLGVYVSGGVLHLGGGNGSEALALATLEGWLWAWLGLLRQPAGPRVLGALRLLAAPGPAIRIATTCLARICSLNRIWTTRVLRDLQESGKLGIDNGVFMLNGVS